MCVGCDRAEAPFRLRSHAYGVAGASQAKLTGSPALSKGRDAAPSACLKVTRLGRCNRREQRPVGLEIEQRCVVEAVQAANQQDVTLPSDEVSNGCADRV